MFKNTHNIHFIGIGGMGVSAIAKLALDSGVSVSGSDLSRSIVTEKLEKNGAKIIYGNHQPESVPSNAEVVVYSRAVDMHNPEVQVANKRKISVYSYPEYTALITKGKKIIAISGTHGKTTTTGLIGKMLINAGLDPTVIVGSHIADFDGNAHLGFGDFVVLEADEYRNAFINYKPYITVITTIDFDHPDYFNDIDDVKNHFYTFASYTSANGMILGSQDDKNVIDVLQRIVHKNIRHYGLTEESNYSASHIVLGRKSLFSCEGGNMQYVDLELSIPGIHNVMNALAACGVADFLTISEVVVKKTFIEYHGAWRRFEVMGEVNGALIVDDYAHHPREIIATINAARAILENEKSSGRVVAVFQPHHQERTNALFDEFIHALSFADIVILTDLYRVPGRTTETEVDMQKMADGLKDIGANIHFVKNLEDVPPRVLSVINPNDIVLIMGAGNINSITHSIVQK